MSDIERAILKIEELQSELGEAEAYIADLQREIEGLNYQMTVLVNLRRGIEDDDVEKEDYDA